MVFTAAWKTDEKLKLMKSFLERKDWPARASLLGKFFPEGRNKNFFTAISCKKEFDRILSEPCPSNVPLEDGTTYSQKVLVQHWIDYFTKEVAKEEKLSSELFLVSIRKKMDLLARIDQMTDEEVDEHLLIARKEDEERDDFNEDIFNVYFERSKEISAMRRAEAKEGKSTGENTSKSDVNNMLPPSRVSEEQPHGFDTAFCSPSTNSSERMGSPLKSPIRPVAESLAAVIRSERPAEIDDADMVDEQEEFISTLTESIPEKFEEDSNASLPRSPISAAIKSPTYDKPSQPSTPTSEAKRGRGRPAKNRPSAAAVINKTEMVTTEEDIKMETLSISDKDSVDQEKEKLPAPRTEPRKESGSGGKVSRRPVVDSPLVSQSIRPRRGKEEETSSIDGVENSRISEVPKDEVKPSPEVADVKISVPISTQTDLSIQGPLLVHKEEKKDNRRPSASRKPSRRSDAVEDLQQTTRDYAAQTTRVEFEKDDKIVIRWYDSEEQKFIPHINLPKTKTEYLSDDDVPLLSLKRGKFTSLDEETESNENPKKGDSNRNLLLTIDTSDELAFGLINQMGYSQTDPTTSSPAKRTRKDDRSKDQSNTQMKQVLLTAWNTVADHKHSSIFAAPVSDRDVHGYSDAVKRKTDLSTIKKEIESGVIRTTADFKHKLLLMFTNAIMFNGNGHDVNTYAREMYVDVMPLVSRLLNVGRDSSPEPHTRKKRIPDDFVRSVGSITTGSRSRSIPRRSSTVTKETAANVVPSKSINPAHTIAGTVGNTIHGSASAASPSKSVSPIGPDVALDLVPTVCLPSNSDFRSITPRRASSIKNTDFAIPTTPKSGAGAKTIAQTSFDSTAGNTIEAVGRSRTPRRASSIKNTDFAIPTIPKSGTRASSTRSLRSDNKAGNTIAAHARSRSQIHASSIGNVDFAVPTTPKARARSSTTNSIRSHSKEGNTIVTDASSRSQIHAISIGTVDFAVPTIPKSGARARTRERTGSGSTSAINPFSGARSITPSGARSTRTMDFIIPTTPKARARASTTSSIRSDSGEGNTIAPDARSRSQIRASSIRNADLIVPNAGSQSTAIMKSDNEKENTTFVGKQSNTPRRASSVKGRSQL